MFLGTGSILTLFGMATVSPSSRSTAVQEPQASSLAINKSCCPSMIVVKQPNQGRACCPSIGARPLAACGLRRYQMTFLGLVLMAHQAQRFQPCARCFLLSFLRYFEGIFRVLLSGMILLFHYLYYAFELILSDLNCLFRSDLKIINNC